MMLQVSQQCLCAAFQTEGKLYLILDFLRGGDLFTRLSKEVNLKLHKPLVNHPGDALLIQKQTNTVKLFKIYDDKSKIHI